MHVFVSYSREDSEAALQIVAELQRRGVDVWIDQNSQRGGDDWVEAIQAAINDCSHLVLLMSPSSISSNTVRDEWTYARKVGASIIPVMLQHCEPPFPLHTMNWIDLENGYDRGIKEIMRSLGDAAVVPGNSQRLHHLNQWSRSKLRNLSHIIRRTAAGLGGMSVLIVLGYFGYDLMKGAISPCETIYEKTALRLSTKVELLQAKGEVHVGKAQLQALSETAQVTALNLKTCCIVLDEGKLDAAEFLQCRASAQDYESNIDSAVAKVEEADELQRSNETMAYERSLRQLNETLESAAEVSASFGQRVNSIVETQPGENASRPSEKDSSGTSGVHGTITFVWDGQTEGYWHVWEPDQYGEYKKIASSSYLRRGESQAIELAPGEYRVGMNWDRGFKDQDVRIKAGEDVSIQPDFGTVTFVWDGETKGYWHVWEPDQYGEYKKIASSSYLRRDESQAMELAPGEYRVGMNWDQGFKDQHIRIKAAEDVSIRPVFGTVTFVWDGETKGYWHVWKADQYGEYKKIASSSYLRRGESQAIELAPGEYRVGMNWDRGFKDQDIRIKAGEDVSIQPDFGTVTFVWDGETNDYWHVWEADQYGEYKKIASSSYLRRGESQIMELAPGKYQVRRSAEGSTRRDVTVNIGRDVLITE